MGGSQDGPFALVFDVAGTESRIQKVTTVQPTGHTALGWAVAGIDTLVGRLSARGVTFARFEGLEQDARGIWRSPGGAHVAWFRDPDGHLLSLTEHSAGVATP